MPDIISIPDITALYAGLIAILGIAIGFVCILLRRKLKINLGDGGNADGTDPDCVCGNEQCAGLCDSWFWRGAAGGTGLPCSWHQ